MRFICIQSCYDNTPRSVDPRDPKFRKGFKTGDSDKPGEIGYELTDADVKRLARVGLFPEYFDIGDEGAQRYIEEHRDELIEIVEHRELPFRELREGETPPPKGPAEATPLATRGDMLGLEAKKRLKRTAAGAGSNK